MFRNATTSTVSDATRTEDTAMPVKPAKAVLHFLVRGLSDDKVQRARQTLRKTGRVSMFLG